MSAEGISVVKVRDVLMISMPADPDDDMIDAIQGRVLRDMQSFEPHGVVMDISAVETLDSFFARMIAETAQMVALMGGRTVIAGMQPSVAVTATQLGLRLNGALTALTVEQALDRVRDDYGAGRLR